MVGEWGGFKGNLKKEKRGVSYYGAIVWAWPASRFLACFFCYLLQRREGGEEVVVEGCA